MTTTAAASPSFRATLRDARRKLEDVSASVNDHLSTKAPISEELANQAHNAAVMLAGVVRAPESGLIQSELADASTKFTFQAGQIAGGMGIARLNTNFADVAEPALTLLDRLSDAFDPE